MSSLLERIRARAKDLPEPAPKPEPDLEAEMLAMLGDEEASPWARRHNGVTDSDDLQRILKLPRRASVIPDKSPIVQTMTERFRRREGSAVSLRPIQAFALYEAEQAGGLFGMVGVGQGKTLISLLAATLFKARKTVLFVPAALVDKTVHEYEELLKDWKIQRVKGSNKATSDQTGIIHVVSYSALQTKNGAQLLQDLAPDLIVADEAHAFAGVARSSRRDRFRFYVRKSKPKLVLLSGSFINRSIRPAATLAQFILGDSSPFPHDFTELSMWSWSLDPSPDPSPPGELLRFCQVRHKKDCPQHACDCPLETPRQGFRRRLMETQGVVGTVEDTVESGLEIHVRPLVAPPEVEETLAKIRKGETATGIEFKLALEKSRYLRQAAAGIELYWTFPRGENPDLIAEWKETRAAYASEIRKYLLKHSRPGMDSPLLLEEAAEAGKWTSQFFEAWKAIRDQVQPETECHWISDFLVKDAVEWGKEYKGIIWAKNPDVGEAIAKAGGFPYFGAGMNKEMVKESSKKKARTIVASIEAFGTGYNLQLWDKALFTYTSSNPKQWHQTIAREHRPGQLSDKVDVFVYLHTEENVKAFDTARSNSGDLYELTDDPQKLLIATYTF